MILDVKPTILKLKVTFNNIDIIEGNTRTQVELKRKIF